MLNYDTLLALTHFKGHPVGGFGGANKNIGIGCADGRLGKKWIHTVEGSDDQWSIATEEIMERISESTKATMLELEQVEEAGKEAIIEVQKERQEERQKELELAVQEYNLKDADLLLLKEKEIYDNVYKQP